MQFHQPKENNHGQRTAAQKQRSKKTKKETDTSYLIFRDLSMPA
jgi:hypothetical protein